MTHNPINDINYQSGGNHIIKTRYQIHDGYASPTGSERIALRMIEPVNTEKIENKINHNHYKADNVTDKQQKIGFKPVTVIVNMTLA